MTGFTTVPDSVIAELKNLKTEIDSIKLMATISYKLTSDEVIKIRECEKRRDILIENL